MLQYIYLKNSIEEVSNFAGKTTIRYINLPIVIESCLNFARIRFIKVLWDNRYVKILWFCFQLAWGWERFSRFLYEDPVQEVRQSGSKFYTINRSVAVRICVIPSGLGFSKWTRHNVS